MASCAAGPCDARSAAVASLGAAWAEPGGGPLAVPLGSQVAVVASRGRGVEVRVAALEQIAGAPPQRLLEEPVEMAAAETLSRGASALLLLRPRGAHHAYPIRLSTNGIRALACEGSPERTP